MREGGEAIGPGESAEGLVELPASLTRGGMKARGRRSLAMDRPLVGLLPENQSDTERLAPASAEERLGHDLLDHLRHAPPPFHHAQVFPARQR
jgi:hypothetical protein